MEKEKCCCCGRWFKRLNTVKLERFALCVPCHVKISIQRHRYREGARLQTPVVSA